MAFTPLIDELLAALRCLPGVGPKSAQRMVLHLMERDRNGAQRLAGALTRACEQVQRCPQCRMFTEEALCRICADHRRQGETLCVVESPADLLAIEQAGQYRGRYFVLLGRLSPLDGIGPEELGIRELLAWLEREPVSEVILATSASVEGETTAYYLHEQLKALPLKVSRIAYGVPLGGELEYIDGGTLAHAFAGRTVMG